jgi:SH3-like domain-containing protein
MKRIVFFALALSLLWAGTASAKRLSVVVEKANVRSGPGTNYEILWSVGKYYPVDVVKTSGAWCQIRDFEGDSGWIYKKLLGKTPAVIVEGKLVNVREGPGKKFKVVFQAEKGVSLKLLGKKKNWLKVQHADGDVGWIHGGLVWGQ